MESAKKLLFVVCLTVAFAAVLAAPPTCPASDLDNKCADSNGGWEEEFFPGIPNIKYEGPSTKNHLAFKWYNPEEVIIGKKMKGDGR